MSHNHKEHNCQECLRIFEAGCLTAKESIAEFVKEIDEQRERRTEAFKWSSNKDHNEAMGLMDAVFVHIYEGLGCYEKKEGGIPPNDKLLGILPNEL
jgi:hypothetical protein